MWLRDDGIGGDRNGAYRANLSVKAQRYLERIGVTVQDLFYHVLATLHDPAYRDANAGALRMEWPRIAVPGWADRRAGDVAEALTQSAARGREVAALLNPETPVPGVTQRPLRPEIAVVAIPHTVGGRNMSADDFCGDSGMGSLWQGRRRNAQARATSSSARTARKNAPSWVTRCPPWAKLPSTSTSTATPSGAMSLLPSGTTNSAAIRCSRNGSPIEKGKSSPGPSSTKKCNISRTRRGE